MDMIWHIEFNTVWKTENYWIEDKRIEAQIPEYKMLI